jgi:hypothetical protein
MIVAFRYLFGLRMVASNPNIRLIDLVIKIYILSLFLISLSVLIGLPDSFKYIAYGFNKYLCFSPLLVGANIDRFKSKKLWLYFLYFIPSFLILSLVNSRGYALFPVIAFTIGYILFSKAKIKYKNFIIIIIIIILPLFMIFTNLGRINEGEYIGTGSVDVYQRLDKIELLLSGDMETSFTELLALSFSNRIFPIGGYAILTQTPNTVPYESFNLVNYFSNDAEDKYKLIRYGFIHISDSNSVGITLFGDFWMYGGLLSLIVGLFFFCVFLVINNHFINKSLKINKNFHYVLISSQFFIYFYAQGKALVVFVLTILASYIISYVVFLIYKFQSK